MNENEQVKEIARTICGLNTDKGCFCDGGYCNYNCLAYEKAKTLYSKGYRKVERGEWEHKGLDCFRKYQVTCPFCKAEYIGNYDAYDEPEDFNFCPHCGTDMRGEKNE